MVKIAYIITAYTDAPQLKKLVDSLNLDAEEGISDFYVHIDSKVDISPFVEALKNYHNVTFLKKRYKIYWGGMNQVWSQYELLKSVFESHKPYDRIACLSGTDYPLWSNKKIAESFGDNSIEYIAGYNITKGSNQGQLYKINTYHLFRDKMHFLCTPMRMLVTALHIKKKTFVTTIDGKRYDVYMGSDYWALTYDCARYVFDVLGRDKRLTSYFNHCFVPSEMVVNTIVMNSKYKNNSVTHDDGDPYKGLAYLTPLHYIVYGKSIKTYRLEDIQELLSSGKMFFRKARTGVSDTLLERIDTLRNENA